MLNNLNIYKNYAELNYIYFIYCYNTDNYRAAVELYMPNLSSVYCSSSAYSDYLNYLTVDFSLLKIHRSVILFHLLSREIAALLVCPTRVSFDCWIGWPFSFSCCRLAVWIFLSPWLMPVWYSLTQERWVCSFLQIATLETTPTILLYFE